MLQTKAMAQTMLEPTINSTLDLIETIKVNTNQVFDLFIEAGERAGEPIQIRMVLDNPADREHITLHYNIDPVTPNFVEAKFDEAGIAILGEAEKNLELVDMRVFVRVNISRTGTYNYKFDLLRADNNVIAEVRETVQVAQEVPVSIRSALDQHPDLVKNTDTDFYVTLRKGEIASGTPVRIRMTLNNKAQAERMTLQVQNGQNYTPLTFNAEGAVFYGPEEGFGLEDQRVNFRANFADAALYGYKLELVRVSDNTVLASRNETAAVNNVAGLQDQIGDEQVRIYPTLATDGFVVLDMGNVRQAQVRILDGLGRTVMTAENLSGANRLSTSGWAKGLYFIKVIKGEEVAGGRFIVR